MFPDIIAKVDELKLSKIRKQPCASNRASAIGDYCERKLYYMRVDWDKAQDTPLELQYIFEEGHDQEIAIIRDIQASGIKVIRQQESFVWRDHQITGSIDGMIVVDDGVIPFDAKSMSPFVWDKISDIDSLKKFSWTKKYVAQIIIYMLMSNQSRGILIFKNKSTGRMKQLNFVLDDFLDLAEEQIQKADRINNAVLTETVPPTIDDVDECKRCQFRLHCLPDQNLDALDFVDNDELDAMLTRKNELVAAYKEYDDLCDQIKDVVKGKSMICGNWHITGKWIDKKESHVKASQYWKSTIKRIEGE